MVSHVANHNAQLSFLGGRAALRRLLHKLHNNDDRYAAAAAASALRLLDSRFAGRAVNCVQHRRLEKSCLTGRSPACIPARMSWYALPGW